MADVVLAKIAIEIAANTSKMVSGLAKGDQAIKKFSGNVLKLGAGLAAGFSFAKIGSDIIEVTSQFQKFEAVLSNTLGSESAAQQALQQIKQFASETPFAVDELTGAFVKLANQGFVPTIDEMRSLGDLASSTGKTFDQLAEAIIDAQTNQFERLKEFGVKASKQGDQVKFTFKGVATTVDNSSEAIKRYILSLGNAVGVSGAMEKISGTLGGRISNLGDAWDNLLVTIGKGNSGVLFNTVKLFTSLANFTTDLFGGDSNPLQALESGIRILNESGLEGRRYADALAEVTKRASALGISLISLKDEATGVSKILIDTRTKPKFIDAEDTKAQVESLETLKKTLNGLNNDFETTDKTDKKKLSNIGQEIITTQALIDKIEDLRKKQKETDFSKHLVSGAKVLFEFNQEDLVKQIADSARAFKDAAKQHEEDFKLVVKIDDDQLTKLPKKIIDIGPVLKAAVDKAKEGLDSLGNFAADAAQKMIDIGGLVSSGIASLADALGTALGSGDFKNFGKSILEAVASFAQQLGALMIASGIAEVVLATGNPVAMIAAGAALVAAGAAIKATLDKKKTITAGSRGGGGGSSGQGSRSFATSRADRIEFDAVFTLKGNDLVASVNNTNAQNGRLRG